MRRPGIPRLSTDKRAGAGRRGGGGQQVTQTRTQDQGATAQPAGTARRSRDSVTFSAHDNDATPSAKKGGKASGQPRKGASAKPGAGKMGVEETIAHIVAEGVRALRPAESLRLDLHEDPEYRPGGSKTTGPRTAHKFMRYGRPDGPSPHLMNSFTPEMRETISSGIGGRERWRLRAQAEDELRESISPTQIDNEAECVSAELQKQLPRLNVA